MLEVVYDVPVNKLVPPVAAAYQFTTPADAAAPNITVPLPQRLLSVTAVIVGIAFTVAVTAVLVPVVQPVAVAST